MIFVGTFTKSQQFGGGRSFFLELLFTDCLIPISKQKKGSTISHSYTIPQRPHNLFATPPKYDSDPRFGNLGLGWVSPCYSNGTVTTLSILEMPYAVMVPTIAPYHSGVGAVVSPVFFYISPSYACFCSFLPYFSLIGCCDHAY